MVSLPAPPFHPETPIVALESTLAPPAPSLPVKLPAKVGAVQENAPVALVASRLAKVLPIVLNTALLKSPNKTNWYRLAVSR